jgi:hypothetical protein
MAVMDEELRHPPTWYRVVEVIDAPSAPEEVREMAHGSLLRFSRAWSDVAGVARVVDPRIEHHAPSDVPEWLVAVEGDEMRPGWSSARVPRAISRPVPSADGRRGIRELAPDRNGRPPDHCNVVRLIEGVLLENRTGGGSRRLASGM